MNRVLPLMFALAAAVGLAGCPENPYEADTWIEKLDNPRDTERAVTELEHIGDPKAIPALGKAWDKQGRPTRILQVIIDLAKPLSLEEAKALYQRDDIKARAAAWELAVPALTAAIVDLDEANPRSIDNAIKAADALGEAGIVETMETLVGLATNTQQKAQRARLAAVLALGKFREAGREQAVRALSNVLRGDPETTPIQVTAAAINALADLRTEQAMPVLVETMYRIPAVFGQIRRALVASGPQVADTAQKILRGQQAEVEALFKEQKLDKYCGDKKELPPEQCQPISMKEYYAAIILGDLYATKAVPDLLAILDKPSVPAYYVQRAPGPSQHNAIFDALKKIGAAQAADKVKALWMNPATDLNTRAFAVGAYGFLARDNSVVPELARLIRDPKTDAGLRQEMLTTYARLANSPGDLGLLSELAAANYEKYKTAKVKADGKPKQVYEKAKKELEDAKRDFATANGAFLKAGGQKKIKEMDPALINGLTEAQKKVDAADAKFDDARVEWKPLDNEMRDYLDFTRGLELHIARVEIAIQCKQDVACYGKALTAKPEEIVARVGKYIKTMSEWTPEDKKGLVGVQIERAALELGKMGAKAESQTGALLDLAKSDDRVIRQSALLALPKVAKLPCKDCETKLDEAIKAGEGKTTLGELNVETTMLRNYFAWAK